MSVISPQRVILSQYGELNTGSEDIHKSLLHNAASPINRLPSEILIKMIVFSLPGLPTQARPYPCLRFSWVCHHWRSVVLGNPMFWNRIVVWDSRFLTRSIIKEALIRSRTLPLHIIAYDIVLLFDEIGSEVNRVTTLCMEGSDPHSSLSHFTSHFPSLAMLFLGKSKNSTSLPIGPLPLLRALQVTVEDLGNLAIPNNFPNLWWLELRFDISMPFIPLVEAMQHLPRLRVLRLFPSKNLWTESEVPTSPIITFHHLEALITSTPLLQLISAPKLLYLECTMYPAEFFKSNKNYDRLCGYDFSKISHIHCEMNEDEEMYVMGKFKVDASDDMLPFSNTTHDCTLVFDKIISSYPNEFYILVDSSAAVFSLLAAVVKKSDNLDEISLKDLNLSDWTGDNDEEHRLLDALRCAKKIRDLTVSGEDFITLCGYLGDGTLCLSLEKLSYSTRVKQDVLNPLLNLMAQRNATMGLRPLEVEVANFHPVPLEALKPAEELGLRLIQKPSSKM